MRKFQTERREERGGGDVKERIEG